MTRWFVVPLMATALAVSGCAEWQGQPKTAGGTIIGAGLGGLAGSQFGHGRGSLVTTGAGVLLGALLGSQVGQSLDRADRLTMEQTTQQTLEGTRTGEAVPWRNPDTGNYGTVRPVQTYQRAGGQVCREFQQTITVGGRTEEGYGTACRQPDGSWRIVG
jgi:surface antigen